MEINTYSRNFINRVNNCHPVKLNQELTCFRSFALSEVDNRFFLERYDTSLNYKTLRSVIGHSGWWSFFKERCTVFFTSTTQDTLDKARANLIRNRFIYLATKIENSIFKIQDHELYQACSNATNSLHELGESIFYKKTPKFISHNWKEYFFRSFEGAVIYRFRNDDQL